MRVTGVRLRVMGLRLGVNGVGFGVWMYIQPPGSAADEEQGDDAARGTPLKT